MSDDDKKVEKILERIAAEMEDATHAHELVLASMSKVMHDARKLAKRRPKYRKRIDRVLATLCRGEEEGLDEIDKGYETLGDVVEDVQQEMDWKKSRTDEE